MGTNINELDISVTPSVVLRRFDVGEGIWRFDQVSQQSGQTVSGSFQGTLYLIP